MRPGPGCGRGTTADPPLSAAARPCPGSRIQQWTSACGKPGLMRAAAGDHPNGGSGMVAGMRERAPVPASTVVTPGCDRRTATGPRSARQHVGRKRHPLTDTDGLLLEVTVTTADVHDSKAAPALLETFMQQPGRLPQLVGVDSAYQGPALAKAFVGHGARTEVVRGSDGHRGFVVLARRWVVERTLSRLTRSRRLNRDHERRTDHHARMVRWAAVIRPSRRLTQDAPADCSGLRHEPSVLCPRQLHPVHRPRSSHRSGEHILAHARPPHRRPLTTPRAQTARSRTGSRPIIRGRGNRRRIHRALHELLTAHPGPLDSLLRSRAGGGEASVAAPWRGPRCSRMVRNAAGARAFSSGSAKTEIAPRAPRGAPRAGRGSGRRLR